MLVVLMRFEAIMHMCCACETVMCSVSVTEDMCSVSLWLRLCDIVVCSVNCLYVLLCLI